MERAWKSAEVEVNEAKADALEVTIDAIQTVEELLSSDATVRLARSAAQALAVDAERFRENARRASEALTAERPSRLAPGAGLTAA